MNCALPETEVLRSPGEAGKQRMLSMRGEPLFYADWLRSVFIHYEVDADALQQITPFKLDLADGRAYVSLVAFTMRDMRPRFGRRLGAWLFRPIATHEFLNVRTYVTHRGEPGIYFLAEWLANPLSVKLGPPLFGLPYRRGKLNYEHFPEAGHLHGLVTNVGTSGRLEYAADVKNFGLLQSSERGTRDEFLMERYAAFTCINSHRRFFRIWHPSWNQTPININILDQSLLTETWPLFKNARLVGANYSPGFEKVWMGRPHRI